MYLIFREWLNVVTLVIGLKTASSFIIAADTYAIREGETGLAKHYIEPKIMQLGNVVYASSTTDLSKEQRLLKDIKFETVGSIDNLFDALSLDELRKRLGRKGLKEYEAASIDMILGFRNSDRGIICRSGIEPEFIKTVDTLGSVSDIAHAYLHLVDYTLEWFEHRPSEAAARKAIFEAFCLSIKSNNTVGLPMNIVILPQSEETVEIDWIKEKNKEWCDVVDAISDEIRKRYAGL